MVRKRLVATVAVAPLLLFAGSAWAETTISNTRTTGVSTSTVNGGAADDIKVTNAGRFELTAGGPAITQNSNNNVNNDGGQITTKGVNGAVGILVDTTAGPVTGNLTQGGTITHSDDFTPTDTDKDGDDDGDFVQGTGKYGIRAIGAGGLVGNVLNTGSITVEGNDSFGISIETDVSGYLRSFGSVTVTGDNARGINVTGDIGGGTALEQRNGVYVSGAVNVRGENAVGIDLSGDINGAFVLQGNVTATGYRYDIRPFTKEGRDNLDADDTLQATAGVRVTGNVRDGVILGAPITTADVDTDGDGKVDSIDEDDDGDGTPDKDDTDDDNDGVLDTDDKDFDNDGIPDLNEGVGSITVYGSAPGLLIGDTGHVSLGEGLLAADDSDDVWGLNIKGSITSDGLLDNVSSTAVVIGAGGTVDLNKGINLDGSLSARAYNADARALWIKGGTTVGQLELGGAVIAIVTNTSAKLPTDSNPATSAIDPPTLPGPFTGEAGTETKTAAIGVDIDPTANIGGAGTGVLNVTGLISVGVRGENVDAIGVRDASGTIDQINISGIISAIVAPDDDLDDTDDDDLLPGNEKVLGRAIALDMSANTSGLQINIAGIADGDDGDDDLDDLDADGDGIDDADEASVRGNILMGTGADTLKITNGTLLGDMSFGLGNDKLELSAGAKVRGAVLNLIAPQETLAAGSTPANDRYTESNLDNQLDITLSGPGPLANADIDNATRLTITNTSKIIGGTLIVGNNTQLFVTVDPNGGPGRENTLLDFTNVTLGDKAVIGMELVNLIDRADFVAAGAGGVKYTIIDADNLTVVGTLNPVGLANSPFFYTVATDANTTTGDVQLVIRLKTAEDLGMEANQAAALTAIYDVLITDEELADSFLSATNSKDFYKLYNQLLPDQGEGLFSALDTAGQALFRLTATRPDMGQKYGPDSFWVQEINVGVLRETGVTIGSETKAFGFIGGYESMGDDGGALGVTLAYMNAEEKDDVAQIGEQTNVSLVEAGAYWRRSAGGWMFAARGAAGYGFFEGERRFIDPRTGTIREATASWGGFTGSANAMVSYEARFGRFYVRPMVSVDYLYLSEGERNEDGDGAFGVRVEERSSSRLSASAEIAIGATFGRDNWWRPELRLGYRQHLAGEIGDTVAQFTGGNDFTLVATEPGEGAAIIGFSLKAGTPMSYVALEGDIEAAEGEDRYNLRLAGRMMF